MGATHNARAFGVRDKLGYMLGELGNNFTFILCSGYLLKFSTDVMGIRAATIGVLIMAVRILDAFTDIWMGWAVDRFHPRGGGKFRPWIKWMCVPVSLCCFLLFQAELAAAPYAVKVVWIVFMYVMWGSVFYTAVNIPYGSMASALSGERRHRAQVSVWRSAGSAVASLLVGAWIPLFAYVHEEGHPVLSGSRMMILAGVFGALAVVSYLCCYYFVRERVRIPRSRADIHLGKKLLGVLTDRSAVGIFLAVVFFLAAMLGMQGMASYVFPIRYHNVGFYTVASLAGSAGALLICSPFAAALAGRFGKRNVSAAFCLAASLAFFLCLLIRPSRVWGYGAVYALAYVCAGFFHSLVWAMIIDVTDRIERASASREDGLVYAVYSFCRKLGQALAPGLLGIFLGIAGYSRETAHTVQMGERLFRLGCLVPALGFLGVTIVLACVYPKDRNV